MKNPYDKNYEHQAETTMKMFVLFIAIPIVILLVTFTCFAIGGSGL